MRKKKKNSSTAFLFVCLVLLPLSLVCVFSNEQLRSHVDIKSKKKITLIIMEAIFLGASGPKQELKRLKTNEERKNKKSLDLMVTFILL